MIVFEELCPHCGGSGDDPRQAGDQTQPDPCELCKGEKAVTLEQAILYFETPDRPGN